jgi:hypothetical protein
MVLPVCDKSRLPLTLNISGGKNLIEKIRRQNGEVPEWLKGTVLPPLSAGSRLPLILNGSGGKNLFKKNLFVSP